MGLLVIHSEHAPNPLRPILSTGDVRCVENPRAARAAYSPDRGDIILAASLADARELLAADPLLDVVLASDVMPDQVQTLSALRAGIVDIWPAAETPAVQKSRMEKLQSRLKSRQDAVRDRWLRYENELRRDQRAGRYIQLGMLPPNPMMVGDYVLRHRIVPSQILSGDFIDYFSFAQHYLAAYVADVAGHGASSAFVTVLLKNFSRRIRREYRVDMLHNPGLILAWLNRELLEQKIDKHVTMALLLIDLRTDTLFHVNAGHYPQVVLVSEDGRARFIEASGKPVGLFPEVTYTVHTAVVGPGERLVLFSDGVLELLGDESLDAKEQRLLHAAEAGDRVEDIWSDLGITADQQGPDDMSCLVVSREP